ncbi:MAG: AbrB/MazE/SpoVT family DNA-binding domain-containing protein [Alphaproteobacteria bacterium]|nr:AbrB/MazE/SpoVT family DNA-binding domain-containing protein [Alphaproteobacteria bacterium]
MGSFTTMTSKGQLTIPKDIRDELNLKAGTRFYVTVRDGEVVALPKNLSIKDLAGCLGKPPRGLGATLADFDEAIASAAAEDDERIRREWHEGGQE